MINTMSLAIAAITEMGLGARRVDQPSCWGVLASIVTVA